MADTHRVTVFTSDGKFSHHIGQHGYGPAGMTSPATLDIGPDGNVYIADSHSCRVQVYTPSGQHIRQIGHSKYYSPSLGAGAGFAHPVSIAVSSEGLVYVADTVQRHFQVYRSTGTFLYLIKTPADPTGVALSNAEGRMYLSSWSTHC